MTKSDSRSKTKGKAPTKKLEGRDSEITKPWPPKAMASKEIRESESEEEIPLKRIRRSRSKKKTNETVIERDRSVIPTTSQLLNHLTNSVWVPTRFPDADFLRETGLYDDVYAILNSMGLQSLLTMEAQPVYQEASSHFFASLEAEFHCGDYVETDGWGFIRFRIKGKAYRMTFREIADAMKFEDNIHSHLPKSSWKIPEHVWPLIAGKEVHHPAYNKNTAIRNPVIRYVHRILGNTLYARRESGNVLEEELTLIGRGIIPLKEVGLREITKQAENPFQQFGMVGLFVRRLLYFQGWAWTNVDKTPQFFFGGLITPLLIAKGVTLGNDALGPHFMDGPYMKRTLYLSGMYEGKHVYSYTHTTGPAELRLPSPQIAMTRTKNSLLFRVPLDLLLGPHGPLDPVIDRRKRATKRSFAAASEFVSTSASTSAPPEASEETVFGPARYYFQPHTSALQKGPLRDAHEYIGKLQRWNKYQDRTIHKLKTKYKELKKTVKKQAEASAEFMKKVADILVKGGVAGCNSKDFVIAETSVPQPRRRSYHETDNPTLALGPCILEHQRRRLQNPSPP